MASSNLKRLQDRAAAIAARLNELADCEERSEEQTTELRRLTEEADKVQSDLEFEQKLAAKEAELRAVVERAAPAPAKAVEPAAEEKKTEIRHILPHHTQLRAFGDGPEAVESAYRCGRWLRATVFKNSDDLRWCRDHGVEARALNEGSNAAGGALVPEEFANRVIRLVETYGTFPGTAENVSMSRDTMVIPKRLTGTTAYFVGEGSSISESEPTYGNVQLVAKKLAVSCRMSSEVVEDSQGVVGMADAVAQEFATSLAYKIDLCGWLGDGTSDFGGIRGIVNKINGGEHTASVVTAASGNTAFETLDIEDFLGVIGKLPIYARQGARWYISPAGKAASIDRLKYAAGGRADAACPRPRSPRYRRGKDEAAWRSHRQRLTFGLRIAVFRRTSDAGHVLHIVFGSEILVILPCDSRSAGPFGPFVLVRVTELWHPHRLRRPPQLLTLGSLAHRKDVGGGRRRRYTDVHEHSGRNRSRDPAVVA